MSAKVVITDEAGRTTEFAMTDFTLLVSEGYRMASGRVITEAEMMAAESQYVDVPYDEVARRRGYTPVLIFSLNGWRNN